VSGLVIQPYILNSRVLKGIDIYEKIEELKELRSTIASVDGQMNFIFENSDFADTYSKNAIFALMKEMKQ
jgi:hypothetical protein